MAERPAPLVIGEQSIPVGKRTDLDINVTRLATGTWVSVPVSVLRGRQAGPRIWITAAIHGDELNGIEIVRQVLLRIPIARLRGTVIAVPIVNVLGFLHQDRYLPDRRDLNRCFPGSARGSLAARMAHLLLTEVVDGSDYGIDLHTGSNHRVNYPQLRVDLENHEVRRLSEAFAAPLAIHANTRDGSLRYVAAARNCPVLVYEGGETLRFDRRSIQCGVDGTLRVLKALGMLDDAPPPPPEPARKAYQTRWTRASNGGILLLDVELGDRVTDDQRLARIVETYSRKERAIRAPADGVVIGLTTNPVVNRGDAIVHLAYDV